MADKSSVAPALAESRSGHPFFMFEHIGEQPAAIEEVLRRNADGVRALAAALKAAESLTLAGIGTSLNAAIAGEYWMRTIAQTPRVRAINSFELAHYFPPARAGSALLTISHRGWKQFSARAIADGRRAAILTASICGQGPREGARAADHVLLTTGQEKSGAHTKSFTTALALLLKLAIEVASGGEVRTRAERELKETPARMARRIAEPAQERAAAQRFSNFRRLLIVGAGPDYVSAREFALKMKEATFTWAEALEVEEFLHGPIACADRETLAVLISSGGAGAGRVAQAARALGEIGTMRLALVNEMDQELAPLCESAIPVEGRDESSSVFATVLSAQLFTYYSALARGTDPDKNRREDARYTRAAAHYSL
jgi:glucosamine--fructose-6-phosphate aminotransferase (isomerizing)